MIAAALAAMTASVSAPAMAESPHRAQWGLFADMANGDYYYVTRGYVYSGLRVEWIKPGQELRVVDLRGAQAILDCRLVLAEEPALLKGSCQPTKGKTQRVEGRIDPDGAILMKSTAKDFVGLDVSSNWGRFRPGETAGEFLLTIAGIEKRPIRPISAEGIKMAPKTEWLAEAFASLGKPAAAAGQPAKAAPSPAAPAPGNEPPI